MKKKSKIFPFLVLITVIFSTLTPLFLYNAAYSCFLCKPIYATSLNNLREDIEVYPGGQPVGIKVNTKGVLVVGLSDVETSEGMNISPGVKVGISIGDSILKINNKEILNSEDMSSIVNEGNGNSVSIQFKHKNNIIEKSVTPYKSVKDNKYKLGLWVRDCTSGIGTLTFYHEGSKRYGALGHPITDIDTGDIISIKSGQITPSNILSVKKGLKGEPGELRGIFVEGEKVLGNIEKNTTCGIYGDFQGTFVNRKIAKPIKIGYKDEIQIGKAQILTTIEGEEPRLYDIEIEKLVSQEQPNSKSMLIRVTDKRLLEKTGGIVQGMSGSPIIQNNKLVGAVTHVLVNKPDVGYGIYIEWMIKDSDILRK